MLWLPRAGHTLGILRQVTHVLTFRGLSIFCTAQVRSVLEYPLLVWMNAAPTYLRSLISCSLLDWHPIRHPQHLFPPPLARCGCKTQTSHFFHQGQGQQAQGNTATCRFLSKRHLVLTWKYIAVLWSSLGPTLCLTPLWVHLHQNYCIGSRR